MNTHTPLLPALASRASIDALVNRVHHVDALTLLRRLPDASVDCIVTDPPYGIGKASWDDVFPTNWITEAWRVTNRMIVMAGNPEFFDVAAKVGRCVGCIVLHNRNGMTRSNVSFGNWIAALLCGDWGWRMAPNHISFNVIPTEKINHPDPKPLQAVTKLLSYYTDPDWIVLDPFGGSGTTALAARNLNRRWITCDLSADYCDLMRRRLAMPYTPNMFDTLLAASE